MVKIAKASCGLWAVQFVSNAKTLFKSASRATCKDWAEFNNYPVTAADALNASVGVNVWRGR